MKMRKPEIARGRTAGKPGKSKAIGPGPSGVVRPESEVETLLAAVIDATDVMLVYLDRDFNYVLVNSAYAATCRMSPDEMVGKNHFALYPHPENEKIFRQVSDSGTPVFHKDKPFEFPDQPERGITYWDWSLVPVKEEDGSVSGSGLYLA